jgi:hypothetical protein
MVTGIVGAVTGIFGAVVGYLGYRRSSQIKALDLRIKVRKQISDAHASLGTVRRLMDDATGSRRSVLSAGGRLNSGVSAAWESMIGADKVEVDNLAASIPSEDANYTSLSAEQLEAELVAAHGLNKKLGALVDKYRDKLAEDEVARRQSAQAQANRVNDGRK